MTQEEAFQQIQNYFKALDTHKESTEQELVFDTEKGIFGTTAVEHIYEWLTQLEVSAETTFLDLGSGDGRVIITASLFCKAHGIEFDETLVKKSQEHIAALESTASVEQDDYENADFSTIDILFCYADHNFSDALVQKLKEEFTGTLYVYQGTFFPKDAVKGKTVWVGGQTPLLTYTFPK